MDHIIKIHNANNESAWQEVTIHYTDTDWFSPIFSPGYVMGVSPLRSVQRSKIKELWRKSQVFLSLRQDPRLAWVRDAV